MIIYFILYGILAIAAIFLENKYNQKSLFIASIILLILVAGFRDSTVGLDTVLYDNETSAMTFASAFKTNYFVYSFLSTLIYRVTNSLLILHLIQTIFIYACLGLFLKRFSKHPTYSLCLFMGLGFFFNTMNQTRQFLAFSFCLLALMCLFDNKWFKFLIFALLGIFTHNVAVVFVFVILIAKILKKISWKFVILFALIAAAGIALLEPLVNLFAKVFDHYQIYFNSWVHLFEGNMPASGYFLIIIFAAVVLFSMLIINDVKNPVVNPIERREDNKINGEEYNFFKTAILCMLAGIALYFSTLKIALLLRVCYLFTPFAVILIPNIISKLKTDSFTKKALYITVAAVFMAYMGLLISVDGSGIANYKLFQF